MDFLMVLVLSSLQVISTMALSETRLPRCQGQELSFTASPTDVVVNCGETNMTAEFTCQYTYRARNSTEPPWWTIGSRTYHKHLPEGHSYDASAKILTVRNISIDKNDTVYVCELHTQENGSSCAYRSKPGRLRFVCKVTEFQIEPYYEYTSTTRSAILTYIVTTIPQNEFVSALDRSFNYSYTIFFSDSISGAICHSYTIPPNSCDKLNGVCKHNFTVFEVPSFTRCIRNADVNVTVLATEPLGHVNFSVSDPVTIGVVNDLVDISFDIGNAMVKCLFSKQPVDSKKTCSIKTGPVTQRSDCSDMHASEPVEGEESHSSHVSFGVDLDFLDDDSSSTRFCFVANASSESKAVVVKGVYDTASSSTVHLKPISSVVASIIVIFGVACFGISKILCSPRVVNGKNQI